MVPKYAGSPAKPTLAKPLKPGGPNALSAADAGIVLGPGFSVRGAGHFDSASHSPLCLYAARRQPRRRAATVVRFADRQLFQSSGRGAARTNRPVGADRRLLRRAVFLPIRCF